VRARLPLLWFDRTLRAYGPLLPLPILALRLAATWAALPSSEQQQARLPAHPVLSSHDGSTHEHACSAINVPPGHECLR
jgi:hypothetical protein